LALLILVLLVGSVAALAVRKVVAKILRAAGFDVIAEKIRLGPVLRRGGVRHDASDLVGLAAGATILAATLVTALDRMQIEGAARFVHQVLADLKRGAAACLLVVAGMVAAQYAARFVNRTARVAGVPFHWAIGEAARFVVIAIVLIDALHAAGV